MPNIAHFKTCSFTNIIRKIAFEYSVTTDCVEQLLSNAMKNYGVTIDKATPAKLMTLWERDCDCILLDQIAELGLAA